MDNMLTAKQIKSAYIALIRRVFEATKIKIYSTTTEEGYETPSFFVQLVPLIYKERQSRFKIHSSYMFETTFLQHEKNETEQLEVMEKLRNTLGDFLEIEGKKYLVEEPEIQFTGQTRNIAQFVFKIELYEDIYDKEPDEKIQTVIMKEEMKHGDA